MNPSIPAAPDRAETPRTRAHLPDDQVRVLLVDDDVRNLETLEVALAETGCQLMRAQSADGALLLLLEHDFAAIVLDVRMPEMDGLELAKLIKGRRRNRDVPILFLTAYLLDEQDILAGYRLGAASYLTKPLHPEILRSKIAIFADLYRKRRELMIANEELGHQVAEREKAEAALRRANQELERRVAERTAEVVRANEVLHANQKRLRVALDAGRMGTWEMDERERVATFDEMQCALLGLPPETSSISEREFLGLIFPDDVGIVRRAINQARTRVDAGGAFEVECRIVRPSDGAVRWLLARGSVTSEGDGRALRTAGVSFDITGRKETEEALQEADRRKNAFLATLAHELRNPLAPISNAIHLLLLKGPPDSELRAARDIIARQTRQLSRLVDDLLDISRITQDRLELRREHVTLEQVVRSAVETSRPLIDLEGHSLVVDLPTEPIVLDADLTRLAQVISNLLNNAARYTERGGRIALLATRGPAGVTIRVTDTGVGMPAEILPYIFDMFVQGTSGRSRSSGGLGIGLALARRLVELHGGSITAHSAGPDMGSEFCIQLPVAASETVLPESDDDRDGAPRAALRVLVVDDNKDAAESLATLLRMMGNDVQVAHDGLEAVAAAAAYEPEVALVDVGLPSLNGYEVAQRIRARCAASDCHAPRHQPLLIALTGFGQESDRQESFNAGFDHHLTKPADLDALMKLLSDLSRRRRAPIGAEAIVRV